MKLRFLLVEDNPLDADVIKIALIDGGIDCELVRVENCSSFITALSNDTFDLILANYTSPGFDDLSALEIARRQSPEVPFIFISSSSGEELAIEALKGGATDYVLKQRLGRLVSSIQRALKEAQERYKLKQTELILAEQKRLLTLIASGHSLEECLSSVCNSLSHLNQGIRACFLLVDVQRLTFPFSITPDFPPSFGKGLKDAPISDLCVGTCGEAVYCGQPITCADIFNDERWSQEWRELCIAHSILACHSTPVVGLDGQPLGSLMLCFNEARTPTDWEYQLADLGVQVARIVFERDRSHLVLRQNEARLRTVAANLPNGAVFIVDHNFRYLLAEGKALESVGFTSKHLVGKTLWEALDPNLATYYETYYRQAFDGEPFSLEHYSHDQYYISHGTPLYNDSGDIDAVLVLSYNITTRKRAELNAEFLATISQELVGANTVDEIVQIIGEQLHHYLKISMCAFVEINEAKNEAAINYNWHQDDIPSLAGVYPILEFVKDEFLQAAKAGQTMVIRDVGSDPRIVDQQRFTALKIGAEINVPLIRDGKWKFSLTVFHQVPYDWREDEIELMRELANRIWAKLEKARAEAALRESRAELERIVQKFNVMLSTITDYVFNFDRDGRILYANQVLLDLWGVTAADAIGKTLAELNYPEAVEKQVMENMRRVFETGETVKDETSYTNPTGISGYFEYILSPALAADSTVEFVAGSSRDISDRKQVELALRESEEQSRNILESINDAFFALDENWLFTYVNQTAEKLLNRTPGDLIGKNFWEEFPGLSGSEFEQLHRRVAKERVADSFTGFYPDHNRWYEVRSYPAKNGITIYFRNVTEQIQAEIAQRQANERLRLLYDTTSDLLATPQPLTVIHNLFSKLSTQLELDYYYNYIVEEKDNRQMLHLRNYEGISNEAAQSIEWIEFGQYVCGQVAQERRQIVLKQEEISTHPKAQLICSVGVTAYAGQPLIVQGRLLGTLAFASRTRTNFTSEEIELLQSTCDQIAIAIERANLMASIQQQAQKLQQANQIKDEFLAVLSHELRSPLNPILGWVRLLQKGKLDPARQAEALATIERNAKLQAQLIEDLLDISRIMQGKLSLTAATVSLTFVISAAVETVRLAAEAKNIQLQLELDSNVASISGDAARLQQVVWNLLTNAVKFTPNGGQVIIELRQVDNLAQIRVIDTGKGINPQFLPYVFEYFRQEDGSTTRKFGGLGLGLAIVRQIVEMHGGKVRAESRGENQGATFIVQLPVMTQTTPLKSEPTDNQVAEEAPLDNIQILLVDDDRDTREFQVFLLEQNGAKVTEVASGLEALQALDQFIPDVLVSDVGMAEMDGYMLMRNIRSRPPNQGGTIPAIALTAYAGEMDYQQAMLAGFQQHISKPIDAAKLLEAITSLVGWGRV
jgi:PAS domain S-box-containing protein